MKSAVLTSAIGALMFVIDCPLAFGDPVEGCEIPEIEINDMPYLPIGESWIPGLMQWEPNRMPGAWINLRPGNYCSASGGNYRGLQPWWYDRDDDPTYNGENSLVFMNLENKLTEAYNDGYRRMILNLPAGMVGDNQNMASSQWWSMPQWKREGLACLIANWLASKPDTQFEIYGAFQNNNPYSLCMSHNGYSNFSIQNTSACGGDEHPEHGLMHYPCAGSPVAYNPIPYSQTHVYDFHRNLQPWQHIGVTRVWLDWANEHWSSFEEFPYCPLYAPMPGQTHFLGCEAIPAIYIEPAPYALDMPKVLRGPAMALVDVFINNDVHRTWDVSALPDKTELMAVLDHTEPYFQIDHMFGVLAWTQRGFVLAAQGVELIGASGPEAIGAAQLTEYMKRVYDFGPLFDGRDFNGDGYVTPQDVTDFNTAYDLYQGKTNCNWVHGDIDQDNYVGPADVRTFNLRMMTPNRVPINLGAAEPMDALTKP
jgi:hypothetical protein